MEEKPIYIAPDTMVEVLDLNNKLIFMGRVETCEQGVLSIREASDLEVPPVFYNDEYKLQYFQRGVASVVYGKVSGSSKNFWRIEKLRKPYASEQRIYFRQQVRLEGQLILRQTSLLDDKGKPVGSVGKLLPCEILDISAGGLLLQSKERYAEGDRLEVKELRVLPNEAPFTFICRVRRVRQSESQVIQYGCEFQDMSGKEQDRLFRAIFVVQREMIRERKNRYG